MRQKTQLTPNYKNYVLFQFHVGMSAASIYRVARKFCGSEKLLYGKFK